MTYGFIIAAGNQTRFNSNIPKALSKIGNKTLLDINIENMSKYCDKVYVVCSFNNKDYFMNYNRIIIDSGYGCGDAVLKALDHVDKKPHDRCFIQWGDSITDLHVYDSLKKGLSKWSDIVVACKYEKDPYVKINISHHTSMNFSIDSVEFSKFGEISSDGLHDLSIFYGRVNSILTYCRDFYSKFFDKDRYRYNHKHANEFNFLDVFNDTDIIGNVVIVDSVNCYSFNTEEEYNKMLHKIGDNIW